MTPRGKIARLPHEVREELNKRLRNGEKGRRVVKWLNSLREVKAVLREEFGGKRITEQNLSEWRNGGHQQWLAREGVVDDMRRVMEEAKAYGEATPGAMADDLALWLTARCALSAGRLPENEEEKTDEAFGKLCKRVVSLRRGDHYARWLEIERKRAESGTKKSDEELEKLFWEWTERPKIRKKLFPSKEEKEARDRAFYEILGEPYPGDESNPPVAQHPKEPE